METSNLSRFIPEKAILKQRKTSNKIDLKENKKYIEFKENIMINLYRMFERVVGNESSVAHRTTQILR